MRYVYDNDLHIHSKLSICSHDEEQTVERILRYAVDNNLKTICITDHFWSENVQMIKNTWGSDFYAKQDYRHISKSLPLPQSDGIRFLFGCETEMDKSMNIGISQNDFDKFDFIVIPTTHMHVDSYTVSDEDISCVQNRAKAWITRLDALIKKDLPFYKIGIAHLTCSLIAPTREEYLEVLNLIPEVEMMRLFEEISQLGAGIELNLSDMMFDNSEKDVVLRPYKIAKKCGGKFYFGSDAHHPESFKKARAVFERVIDTLELEEKDKFII